MLHPDPYEINEYGSETLRPNVFHILVSNLAEMTLIENYALTLQISFATYLSTVVNS